MKWTIVDKNTIGCTTSNGYLHQISPTNKRDVVGFMASYEYKNSLGDWATYLNNCIAEFDRQLPNYKFRR